MQIFVHPKYDPATHYKDVAVMVLRTPLPANPKVQVIEVLYRPLQLQSFLLLDGFSDLAYDACDLVLAHAVC